MAHLRQFRSLALVRSCRYWKIVVGAIKIDVVSPPVRRLRACPGDVFALLVGEELIRMPGFARQPLGERISVLPIHVDHRLIAAAPALVGWAIPVAAAVIHTRVPFREADGEPPDGKSLCDDDA